MPRKKKIVTDDPPIEEASMGKTSPASKIVLYLLIPVIIIAFIIAGSANNSNNTQPLVKNRLGIPISNTPTNTTTPTNLPSSTPTPTPDLPPRIFTYQISPTFPCDQPDPSSYGNRNTELVCIGIGEWQGNGDIVSIPIVGHVYGSVKRITVDGKDVYWNNVREIYTRMDLKIQLGLNRFLVVAEDNNGNKSELYLDINAVKPDDNKNVNVNINQ